MLQEYRRTKRPFLKFTQITPLRATLWFTHRLFTDMIEYNNCATFVCSTNIQDPYPYYENFPDFNTDGSPHIWASAVFRDISKRKWDTFMSSKNIQDPNHCFQNLPRSHHEGYPLVGVTSIFQCNLRNIYVLFMCFKRIRDPNHYFENFTRTPPLWATLCFVCRLLSRYLWKQLRNIYVLLMCTNNIIDENLYFENFRRLHLL